MYNSLSALPTSSADSDIDSVRDVLDGHIGSFELLMRRYNNRLYRVARGMLSDQNEAMDEELPIKYRSVFVLRAVQQLDTRETASLNLNESTVRQRFLRAKCMLQINLMRQAENSSVTIWEFAGARCDQIVTIVFADIKRLQP